MPNLTDELKLEALFTLLKGEPGTRKSTSALSYPLPQYWSSSDRKMNSLLLPARDWKIDLTQVDYDSHKDWDKPRQKLESFKSSCKYKTIIVDTITSTADNVLRQAKHFKGGNTKVKEIAGVVVNSIEDYNAEDSALSELIALCKDIHELHNVNIVLIAHVMVAEYRSATSNETHVARTIVTAGKRISLKIPAYCEEVYHFNVGKAMAVSDPPEYTCLTQHTGDDFARTILPIDRTIKFNNRPLYTDFIKPKMEAFRNDLTKQNQQSPETTTNK